MSQPSYQFSSPWFRRLGFLAWLALLVLAMVFYKERAIFLDGALQVEKLINLRVFKIYHYRLTNPLTQVLALGAVYLQLPLKAVLFAYSINFILLFGGIYWLIVGWLKNDYLGWALVFFFTLMVLDSFYFLPPELYQGSAMLLLWWAVVLRYPAMKKPWVLPVLVLLLVLVVSDSRLLPAVFLFCWVFFWLSVPALRHWKYYLLLALLFVLVYIHGQYFVSWYDEAKMNDFFRYLKEWYPTYWEIPANAKFVEKCIKFYYFYPLFLIIIVVGYMVAFAKRDRRIDYPLLKLALVLGANLAFILLLHIGSPNTYYRFYSEVNYLPLTILTTIPLLFDIIPTLGREKWVLGLFVFILMIRINLIASNGKSFKARHQWYTEQMDKATEQGSNRSIIHIWNAPRSLIVQAWASPQETLLLSALDGPKHSRTLMVAEDAGRYKKGLDRDSIFMTYYQRMPVELMNPRYFNMGGGEYIFLD